MKKLKHVAFALLLSVAAALPALAQEVKVIKYAELEQLRQLPHDTLYVVNFWATWCGPCVKELPYFEAANKQYKNQPVKVILVSMDAVQDLEKRVNTFAKKRSLQSELLLLDEPDGNTFIDKVDQKWTGAIPATIMFNNKRNTYYFLEGEMKEEQLQQLIQKYKP
ncbi:TlpA family protein disulfide reductase [Pontibacter qinzhouensis]|uniref:TlpA family protein disulfide reductase n=1 Tax=Pontibacter qinzhouensis TaxID=2603253 RepID=A0A5C8KBQ5_9BACT|nr:TlpA disulfide reductase family protein [Pontibacter qinzhouensis]TXK47421.1 TlpA family protein disulfide reductase [Pontibacter qinzhouensis]